MQMSYLKEIVMRFQNEKRETLKVVYFPLSLPAPPPSLYFLSMATPSTYASDSVFSHLLRNPHSILTYSGCSPILKQTHPPLPQLSPVCSPLYSQSS